MKILSTLFILLLIFFGISFAILNSSTVSLNYYLGHTEISLSLLLAITLSAGAVLGFILATPTIFRLKRGNRKLKNRIKQTEQEVGNLRAIPIKDSH